MNSKQASEAISAGYIINVNLPDWKSNTASKETAELQLKQKQQKQLVIAGGILAALVVAIMFVKR